MLTFTSASVLVMSDSSRARSSASTWIVTRNTDADVRSQVTSTSRGLLLRRRRRWCSPPGAPTPPPPLVMNPRISSPGTGVQHRASLTWMSLMPLTSTPRPPSPPVRRRPSTARTARRPPRRPAPRRRAGHDLGRRAARDVVLPDRGVQRGDVLVAQLVPDAASASCGDQPLHRHRPARRRLGDGLLAELDRLLAARLGEVLPDLGLRPGRGDERQPVPARALVRALEVKISTNCPLDSVRSSGTSRPSTLAPMHRCPTSVCTA